MPLDTEFLKKRLTSGLIFYIGARLTDEVSSRFARKYLKEHADLAVGVGSAIATELLGEKMGSLRSYIDDVIDAMSDYGLYREVKILAEKEPVCWAQDANTIVCKNFDDLANAIVFIDGTQMAADSYTVSGDQIQLSNPLSSGEHTLVVVDGTKEKAFKGKIYV